MIEAGQQVTQRIEEKVKHMGSLGLIPSTASSTFSPHTRLPKKKEKDRGSDLQSTVYYLFIKKSVTDKSVRWLLQKGCSLPTQPEVRTQSRQGPSQLGPWGALVPRVQEAGVNQHHPHPVGGEGL